MLGLSGEIVRPLGICCAISAMVVLGETDRLPPHAFSDTVIYSETIQKLQYLEIVGTLPRWCRYFVHLVWHHQWVYHYRIFSLNLAYEHCSTRIQLQEIIKNMWIWTSTISHGDWHLPPSQSNTAAENFVPQEFMIAGTTVHSKTLHFPLLLGADWWSRLAGACPNMLTLYPKYQRSPKKTSASIKNRCWSVNHHMKIRGGALKL